MTRVKQAKQWVHVVLRPVLSMPKPYEDCAIIAQVGGVDWCSCKHLVCCNDPPLCLFCSIDLRA